MEFKLPDIGEGVHEGEITKWLVQAGQQIQADQPMVEVMTDKATVEIPSPVSGTVAEIVFKEGQTVEVGKVILRIDEAGKAKAAPAPAAAAPAPAKESPAPRAAAPAPSAPAQGASKSAHRVATEANEPPEVEPDIPFNVLATPATRKLARDLKIDLGGVSGSGPNGRVTKDDVQLAFEGCLLYTSPSPRD